MQQRDVRRRVAGHAPRAVRQRQRLVADPRLWAVVEVHEANGQGMDVRARELLGHLGGRYAIALAAALRIKAGPCVEALDALALAKTKRVEISERGATWMEMSR